MELTKACFPTYTSTNISNFLQLLTDSLLSVVPVENRQKRVSKFSCHQLSGEGLSDVISCLFVSCGVEAGYVNK